MVSDLSNTSLFSLDIETTGLRPIDSRILLVQISTRDVSYVINPGKVKLEPILPFLSDPNIKKIIQNGKFDTSFFRYLYNTKVRNIFDTMLSEQLLDTTPGIGVSLDAMAKRYFNIELDKSVRNQFLHMKPMQAFTDQQIEYAGKDASILLPLYDEQMKKLKVLGLEKIADIEGDLSAVVAGMENSGIPINAKKWTDKLEVYKERHEESRLKMNSLIFDDTGLPEQMGLFVRDGIDLDSPKKLKAAFQKIGLDIETTKEQEIALIDHPAAKELLNYRELQKIISSYGKSFIEKIHPFTDRIHPDFKQIGARTGRFSCREPNVQQIPAEFRECVGLEGYKIVVADFSQIELRILAELSQDEGLVSALKSGADLHKSTAARMFNIPIEKVDTERRAIAKTINFGLVYGIGIGKLKDKLNAEKDAKQHLSFNQVKQLMAQYKVAYKGAIDWLRNTGEAAYAEGYCTTILGRRRNFTRPVFAGDSEVFDKQVASLKRQGANTPIQGTSADITKLAMVNLDEDLMYYNYRAQILIQVHDEIVVLAHNSQAESVKQVVEESMLNSASEVLKDIPVKVDAYITDYWKKG